jgi:hypothetical protein
MPQTPADRFFSTAHRAAVTATPRQMIAEEVRDDLLIANLVASHLLPTSLSEHREAELSVDDSAELGEDRGPT